MLDEDHYRTEDFKALYFRRWRIETYYGLIKSRLSLEHFSGRSLLSVQQDFFATLFISNLESVLTETAEDKLDERSKSNKNRLQVNRAVSFNLIKHQIFDLLLSEVELDQTLELMTQIFLQNPTAIRPLRSFPRLQASKSRLVDYYKRRRSIVF